MLSKAQISLINSLKNKKFRKEHHLFIVEGIKSVQEFLDSTYLIQQLYMTEDASAKLGKIPQNIKSEQISSSDFAKISQLMNPQGVLALVKIPEENLQIINESTNEHVIVLDNIQDPGNLGTIIRTAEWFGIRKIICSTDTVDVYNPKVVQATMGSLARIQIQYTDLELFLQQYSGKKFGAFLNGKNIYETDFGSSGLIILGNEGNGISESIQALLDEAVTIPRMGNAESLNVAVATTVFCSEIARQQFCKLL